MAEPVAGAGGAERRGNGTWVVLTLFVAAGLLGIIAFWRFTRSDRFIQRSLVLIKQRGPALSAEGCVDEVMGWNRRCEAMKTLCDGTIPRAMEMCLAGSDRHAYCAALGDKHRATSFGVAECRRRVKLGDRAAKKVCALSFGAIATHCERLRLQDLARSDRQQGGAR